jgi:hypothetical protein
VHYGSPQWIEIQTKHLRAHVSVPYQTWTSLERIDPAYAVHFDHVIDQAGRHSDKLNHLAIEITNQAAEDDLLMFLDGDAFPIADPVPLITDGLAKAPLIAVRRAESNNDRQPHPCFCVTTVGTWRRLGGDWSPGYRWVDARGKHVTDVGGNLLRELELTNTPWVEVLRSNHNDLDPIFFAIYGDTIYHHGAGFRAGELTRTHHTLAPTRLPVPQVPVLRRGVMRINHAKWQAWERRTRREQAARSERMLERIRRGDADWLAELR